MGRIVEPAPKVKELPVSDEFTPRERYKVNVFDLRRFGVPYVPSISQTGQRQTARLHPVVWHVHKGCIEFVYCATGACDYESEGRTFHLSPGMMFVSRPHEAHRQLACPKDHATFCLMFRPSRDRTARWFAETFARIPRIFSCGHSVPKVFGRIFALAGRGDTSLGSRIRMQTLVQALLLEILDSAALSIRQKVPEVFGEMAERMRRHPEREYPLDALVAESGMSKASFISLFKRAYGHPPRAFLLRCRIDEAKRLIEKGVAVKAVADRFGFSTAQHFSRTFRNFTGSTPTKWLATQREQGGSET